MERTTGTTTPSAIAVGVVAIAPVVWYGADRPIAQALALVGALALVSLVAIRRPDQTARAAGDLLPMLLAVALACAVALAGAASWSLEPARAWDAVLVPCLLILAVPAAVAAGGSRLLPVLGAVGATAGAAFGVASVATGLEILPFEAKSDYLGFVVGTFVNRNAAADHFLLGIACAFAAIATDDRPLVRRWCVACIGILLLALLGTGSRAGIAAGALTTIGCALVLGRRARTVALVLAVVLVPLAGAVHLIRPDAEGSDLARVELWSDAARSIASRPWTGAGAGTYPLVSVVDRDDGVASGFSWDSSHDVYLDVAATMGVPFLLACLALAVWSLWRIVRRGGPAAPMTVVALSALALHALVDFSPATPGVVLLAALLVGVGLAKPETP